MKHFSLSLLVGALLTLALVLSVSAQTTGQLLVLDRAGDGVTTVTDGNTIRLALELPDAVAQATPILFYLDTDTQAIGECQIPAGQKGCITAPFPALGWYWNNEGQIAPERTLFATTLRRNFAVATVNVLPRPVVMVHGFASDFTGWQEYLGPSGYLARIGLPGYAVGDGQVEGVMRTGNLLKPKTRTNTIAQNAAILAEYIANVKAETGAEQVDLLVHSMGGFISRKYIDTYMDERDVAQLIMLGTPHGGSDCILLASAIGWYDPAGFEIRSDYMRNVFNRQTQNRRGVPFYEFAGTSIQRRILSPCSETPNDLVVSLESATAIPLPVVEVPLLHTDLNTSETLFDEHIAPLLRRSPRAFASQQEQSSALPAPSEPTPVQFSQLFTGTVRSGAGNEHVIHIDNDVAVASFGIFDPSRSLTVTVRGASGNLIVLNPEQHGLTIIDDPDSLLYLGYGFENPRPGPWRVTVQTTDRTPPLGVDYAILVQYVGGATIAGTVSNHVPSVGEEVTITATLQLGDDPLLVESATVLVHTPDGRTVEAPVLEQAEGIGAVILPEMTGIYAIDVDIRSFTPDGAVIQRSVYLAFEAFAR